MSAPKCLIWFSRCLPILFISAEISAQTYVSGPVEGVWSAAGNPYYVEGTLIILHNTSLTLLPGVELFLGNPDSIKVYGTLWALGDEGDSVRFDNLETPPWRGIWFMNGSTDCRLEYVLISEPIWGVRAEYSQPLIKNCTIEAQSVGILAYYSDLSVLDCNISISAADADGIHMYHSDAIVTGCRISNTGVLDAQNVFGIRINQSEPQIIDNDIRVDAQGMACGIWAQETFKSSIRYNLIQSHGVNLSFGGFFILGSPTFVNNTVAVTADQSNPARDLYLLQDSDPLIENCILFGDGASEGIFALTGCEPIIRYTDLFNHYQNTVGCTLGVGSFNQDPLFVNSAEGDYHLQSQSRCIDAGNPLSPPDSDGTRTDLGCYYYDQSVYVYPPEPVPSSLALFGAFPNPFNAQVELFVSLPYSQSGRISIYDQRGSLVERLVVGDLEAGENHYIWKASNSSSGIYWAELRAEQGTLIKKLCLVR